MHQFLSVVNKNAPPFRDGRRCANLAPIYSLRWDRYLFSFAVKRERSEGRGIATHSVDGGWLALVSTKQESCHSHKHLPLNLSFN